VRSNACIILPMRFLRSVDQWNSGATRDSNRGRRVLIPSALTTTPPSHTEVQVEFCCVCEAVFACCCRTCSICRMDWKAERPIRLRCCLMHCPIRMQTLELSCRLHCAGNSTQNGKSRTSYLVDMTRVEYGR